MLNKKQASKVSPIVTNEKAWIALEEFLRNKSKYPQGAGGGTIGTGPVPSAGKVASLEMIKGLKLDYYDYESKTK